MGTGTLRPVADEWREGWPTAVAAMLVYGIAAVHLTTLGVFLKPLHAEFGWTKSQITSATFICAMVGLPGAPLGGWIVDRIGVGRVAAIGLPFFLGAYGLIGLWVHSLFQWWAAWVLVALGSIFMKQNVWVMAVAPKFDRSRGLALSVLLMGPAGFAIFQPALAQLLLERFGWRAAYGLVALIMFALAAPLAFFVLGDKPKRAKTTSVKRSDVISQPGMTLRQAVSERRFWQLTAAGCLAGVTGLGVQIYLVSMLQERGLPQHTGAFVVGAAGAASMAGRLGAGLLLDRMSGALVGAVAFLCPAIAALLLMQLHGQVPLAIAVAALFGLALGSEVNVLAYLTSRYFGLRNYGAIFGVITGIMIVGSDGGPLLLSLVRDRLGSYDPVAWIVIGLGVVASLLVAAMGRYTPFALPSETGRESRGG